MNRRKIIGVIGEANIHGDEEKEQIAFEIGKLLMDNGFIIATGGMGGVMETASRGARSSSKYREGSIIGVKPDYNDESHTQYLDIVIPTGMGIARNVILTSMCDAVIAIGGRSGTLSEIALSWQMGKLIIAMDVEGWSRDLKSLRIDNRREDEVFSASTPEEAMDIIRDKIDNYPLKYSGVQRARIGNKAACKIIKDNYTTDGDIEFIGKGSEGYVYHDNSRVYKVIDNDHPVINQYWRLKALSEDIRKDKKDYLLKFDVDLIGDYIVINYDHFPSRPYKGGHLRDLRYMAKELKRTGWLITDFQPKNIRLKIKNDKPVIVDIGHSFEPYSEDLFRKMCRRMFVSSVIGHMDDIKKYLSETNDSEEFSGLKELGYDHEKLKKEFNEFFNKVSTIEKKDVLNPLISILVSSLENVETIFDYGSGKGDMSSMLKEIGYKVTAYDIDENMYERYKEKYYKNIPFVDKNKLINEKIKFDLVLCSLVFCHPLGEKRNEIIDEIMKDIKLLSGRYALIAICNPLYSNRKESDLQQRIIPDDFSYEKENKILKKIKITGSEREDYHRPVSFYIDIFKENKMKLLRIDQTTDSCSYEKGVMQSDFMTFLLEVN